MMRPLRAIVLFSGVAALTLLLMAPPVDAVEGSPLDCPSAVLVNAHAGARALARSARSALAQAPLLAAIPLRVASVAESVFPPGLISPLTQSCVLRC